MKQEEEEEDEEMGIFYNPSKIINFMPFILIIDETSNNTKDRKLFIKV